MNDISQLQNIFAAVTILMALVCVAASAFGYQCLACFVQEHPILAIRKSIIKARSLYVTACVGGASFAVDEFLWLYGRINYAVPLHVGALSGIVHSAILCMLFLGLYQGIGLARDVVACIRVADHVAPCSSCREDSPRGNHDQPHGRLTRVK